VKDNPVTFAKDLLIPGHATMRRWDDPGVTNYERARMVAMDVAMAALLIAPVARVAGRALDKARLAREITVAERAAGLPRAPSGRPSTTSRGRRSAS
jgi:hypothetical protein